MIVELILAKGFSKRIPNINIYFKKDLEGIHKVKKKRKKY